MAETIDHANDDTDSGRGRRGKVYDIPASGRGIDVALMLGLLAAFALIATAMSLGGSAGSFVNTPSLLIVFCGTLAVTMVSFTVRETISGFFSVAAAIFAISTNARRACQRIIRLADIARGSGILALDALLPKLGNEPFLQRAVALAVDGAPPQDIDNILSSEIDAIVQRQTRQADVLRRAAEVAPAMGLIGTLVGLIQMLANLDDPSTIGPAMAVALLTTFYGAIMAYMVFSPLASKLERNTAELTTINQIYRTGAISIARQENPRRLIALLNTVLPASQRLKDD